MKAALFKKSWVSPVIYYSSLSWTILCIGGTFFVLFKYEIFMKGLFATLMVFFLAIAFWGIPFIGLLLLSIFVTPDDEPSPYVMFKDLIRKGVEKRPE